tara:strand:- start:14657 stop:15091 length:435 start_codon:yes stop_codon:yes gene_type:complete
LRCRTLDALLRQNDRPFWGKQPLKQKAKKNLAPPETWCEVLTAQKLFCIVSGAKTAPSRAGLLASIASASRIGHIGNALIHANAWIYGILGILGSATTNRAQRSRGNNRQQSHPILHLVFSTMGQQMYENSESFSIEQTAPHRN